MKAGLILLAIMCAALPVGMLTINLIIGTIECAKREVAVWRHARKEAWRQAQARTDRADALTNTNAEATRSASRR